MVKNASPGPSGAEGSTGSGAARRSARACLACRKTKNRCSGETPCERCARLSKSCVYDRPDGGSTTGAGGSDQMQGKVQHLEGEMESMRVALSYTVATLKALGHLPNDWDPFIQSSPSNSDHPPDRKRPRLHSPSTTAERESASTSRSNGVGPVLPNYPAPAHPLDNYRFQLLHSPTQPTIDLPPTVMQTEFESIASSAAEPDPSAPPIPARQPLRRRQPPPPNAFPDAVTKMILGDGEARELFQLYMTTCHPFFPILDEALDTYELVRTESPWTFAACLYVACRAREGSSPPSPLLTRLLEEAHGIARSSLFAIVTKTRAVQAMAILAAFSMNGFLPASHALSMGVEFNLHVPLQALARLRTNPSIPLDDDHSALVFGARTWMQLLVLQQNCCRGTGRALRVVDEESISLDRLQGLIQHPLANAHDISLAAQVELMSVQSHAIGTLSRVKSQSTISRHSMTSIRRYCDEVQSLYGRWAQELHRLTPDDSLIAQLMKRQFKQAELEIIVCGMNGHSLIQSLTDSGMRELSLAARGLAQDCLNIVLGLGGVKDRIQGATHSILFESSYCALLLLRVTKVLPEGVETKEVVQLARQLADTWKDIADVKYFSKIVWSASSQLLSFTANCTPVESRQPSHSLDLLAALVPDGSNPTFDPLAVNDPLYDWLAVDNPNGLELDWSTLVNMSDMPDLTTWDTTDL